MKLNESTVNVLKNFSTINPNLLVKEGSTITTMSAMKNIVARVNVEEKFLTTYYEFPGNFTTNLRESKKFLQITVGVSTQYDEEVMVNVESHQLALRGIILGVMSEYSEQDVAGRDGKQGIADAVKDALNEFLEDKEGFGGVEGIHFTSFVLQ